MKNKGLLLAIILYFLIVNTSYFWESHLGLLAFPFYLILGVVYLGFIFVFIRNIYFLIKENFSEKKRFITCGLLLLVLTLTFLKPKGIFDFERLESSNILEAQSEGAANCTTVIKLKKDYTFNKRSICFGVSKVKGNFIFQNDTIYFKNIQLGKLDTEFYSFAVIEPDEFNKMNKHFILKCFKNKTDSTGTKLNITKIEWESLKHL
ncbi:hypothetical protein EQG68_10205 [Flavobacterium piscinae]|uniref:Uncharacterized protein n=1 Tax=Flavobacterium piscinae TaxID=2506424 RepID=A0A4Q1KP83_9FLAO|nr:hypothetical protein [Flavobacterium piscinae]RXR31250.1 hypothetical protein EQG68_10205 [Flavobacterium piscinae]